MGITYGSGRKSRCSAINSWCSGENEIEASLNRIDAVL